MRMLLGAGKPIEFVAAELKRSAKAVKGRAYILRISLKRVKLKPKAKGKPSADAKTARDEFLAHRKTVKKGASDRKLTPLQRRMQSGGPA